MATIDDIKIPSITEMSTDEAIEYLRQLRLSRRTPVKKQSSKKSQAKALPKINKDQAAELLKLLGDEL